MDETKLEDVPVSDKSCSVGQLVIDSEHRLRSENLSWDIDVWYPVVQSLTFPTKFLPLSINEARAILSFHNVSWRHAKSSLAQEEIAILKNLERELDSLISTFPDHCAFLRLCGRSPKDGEPLHRDRILVKYEKELNALLAEGLPRNGNTKMIAIARTPTLKVSNGKEAMSLLLTSERAYSDMLDWTKYGEPEQICLRQWDDDLFLENEFRVFVCNNRITAISQYDHYTYFPSLAERKDAIQLGIFELFSRIHTQIGSASYVFDIGYFPTRVMNQFVVIEFSPFLPCTGASLFSWTDDIDLLEGNKEMEFRIKHEADLHPQLEDLVEINWDMRWTNQFIPYEFWLQDKEQEPPSLFARVAPQALNSFLKSLSANDKNMITSDSNGGAMGTGNDNPCETTTLFVYGTLKRGFQWNQKYLSPRMGARFVSEAITVDAVPLVVGDCGVPYVLGDMIKKDSEDDCISSSSPIVPVIGEVWEVSSSCLKNLDDYEGISKGYYSRQTVKYSYYTQSNKKETELHTKMSDQEAFIYVLNHSTAELRAKPKLSEYTLEMHLELYRPIQHIQIKQKNYYKVASTWGKTQKTFDESTYALT